MSKERIGAAFAQATGYERLTIEQVCQASGFANTISFNRSFKAIFGMTPSEFRRTKK
ncbi:MAG: AraC family transcriptional regulator [Bacteroidales bacterium]|nr:AraC family transcriptional regulator [Bacteroidales bacterium]